MEKVRRTFMNSQVDTLCGDTYIRGWPKTAIEGAANVAWRLRKTSLLFLQAKEALQTTTTADVKQKGYTINSNVDRMINAQKSVMSINAELKAIRSKEHLPGKEGLAKSREEELEDALTELKNAQEALRKAMEERLRQAKISREGIDNLVERETDVGEFKEEELDSIIDDINRMTEN